jgi:hypothetical protein
MKSELPLPSKENYRSIWHDLAGVAFSQEWVKAGDINTHVIHAGQKGNPAIIMIGGTGGHGDSFCAILGPLSRHLTVMRSTSLATVERTNQTMTTTQTLGTGSSTTSWTSLA